mgnify:CR=1 FL=1
MNWFDRVIGFVSPKAACTRIAWRQQLDLLRGFGYDAADNGRSNMNWRAVNEAADLTDRSARDVVRARARDLERNSDIFNGVVSSYKRNIIGTGFTLQVRTGNDELDSQIEKLWKRWTKKQNCDVTQQQSFNDLLRMAVVRKKVDGGIIFKSATQKAASYRSSCRPWKLMSLPVLSHLRIPKGTVSLVALSLINTTARSAIGSSSTTSTGGK